MATSEQALVQQITADAAQRIRTAGFGLYTAMRIIGYVTVALAETLDLEGPADQEREGRLG